MRDNREVKRRKTGEVPYMGFNDKKLCYEKGFCRKREVTS